MKEIATTRQMPVILLSAPEPFAREAVILNRLFAAGLAVFHLRRGKKEADNLIPEIDPRFRQRLVLPYKLYRDNEDQYAFCRRLHFSETHREETPAGILNRLHSKNIILSTSIHEAASYNLLHGSFTYTFFSPVYNSISKPGYPAMSPVQLEVLRHKKAARIIALGGISAINCREAIAYGFDGIAILGALWHSEDPIGIWTELQAKMNTTDTHHV